VYQTVPATAGTTYRFTFSARGRGSNEPSPAASEAGLNMNIRAGIDPNGSGVWNDADVVWGAAGSPHDTWQQFTVEATATGGQITVFTSADWGVTGVNQCRQFMDTWYDAAELAVAAAPTAIAQSSPTPPPQATQPPVPTATVETVPTEAAAATLVASLTPETEATAVAEATITPAGGGTICVNAFLDENGNGLHDANEGYVTGVTLTVAQGDLLVGQAASTGTDVPACFPGLAPGTYQVAQTVPPLLEMTTQGNATIEVGEGQTVGLEFGSRLRPAGNEVVATATAEGATGAEATATAEAATSDGASGGGMNLRAIGGLLAILLGIVLLGVLIFYVVRR
jgi:hypothetical protein